jgi:S-DNA-T family DNA segregation ATPase FtsK/SpoIIIE
MAKAKGYSRPRVAAPPPRSGRRRRSNGPVATILRPIAPVITFLLTPLGLATAIVVVLAAALPWLSIVGVLDAFRRAVLESTGVVCYLIVLDLLALILVRVTSSRWRTSRTFWRIAAGWELLGIFAWGVLGWLHPDASPAGVNLQEFSAGGRVGRALVAPGPGMLLWLASLAAGCMLVSPSGSRRSLVRAGHALRWLWRQNLLGRSFGALRSAVALSRSAPVAALAPDVVTAMPGAEVAPPPETLAQGAADAFRRTAVRERVEDVQPPTLELPELSVVEATAARGRVGWQLPSSSLLSVTPPGQMSAIDNDARAKTIVDTLASFGVDVKVVQINQGPSVTQFGLEPGWEIKYRTEPERDPLGKAVFDKEGKPKLRTEEVSRTRVRVSQVTKLQNDLALALAASSIRIEAPVPGKPVIGIEVPNTTSSVVSLRSVVESPQFQKLAAKSKLALALGMGVSGEAVVADLATMPHLLIAGTTGSGKSVCINALIACILMHATPEDVRCILIDPKRVEMAAFANIPHLALSKIITDIEDVPGTLQGVIREMEDRYKKFEKLKVRNLEAYNKHPQVAGKLPRWVIVIDELADLMMAVPFEVERQICRLAQLARATGIHLVVATQRPSVDVITGLIKANFPTRIAFAVSSQVDSRVILDSVGAEKLLGRGDMLYMPTDTGRRRLQGVYVSDQEIERLVDFWGAERWEQLRPMTFDHLVEDAKAEQAAAEVPEQDELLEKARALAAEHSRISTSMLQRRLRIGYPRAARLIDTLEDEGVVGDGQGGSSREVIGSDRDSIFGDL